MLTPDSYTVITQKLIALAQGHTVFESEASAAARAAYSR
jgi:hypothetical protein